MGSHTFVSSLVANDVKRVSYAMDSVHHSSTGSDVGCRDKRRFWACLICFEKSGGNDEGIDSESANRTTVKDL